MGNSTLNCKTICNAIRSYDESTEFTNEYEANNDYNENINISKIQSNSIDLSSNPSSYEISKIIFEKSTTFDSDRMSISAKPRAKASKTPSRNRTHRNST